MKIQDLEDGELRVFVGLLREVLGADQQYSEPERALVEALSRDVGADRFRAAMDQATRRYPDRGALKEAVKDVERREARQLIFDQLVRAAAVDGVDQAEEKPLRWLTSWWTDIVIVDEKTRQGA